MCTNIDKFMVGGDSREYIHTYIFFVQWVKRLAAESEGGKVGVKDLGRG